MTVLVSLALGIGIQAAPPPLSASLEPGRALTALFYKRADAEVWARFSERMKQGIPTPQSLGTVRGQVEQQLGVEEAVLDERIESIQGFEVYLRTARFSKAPGPVLVQWALGPSGTVEGFFVRLAPKEAPTDKLEYKTKTTLRLPFSGAWYVFWGGRSLPQNYHAGSVDQRFAYDLLIQRAGVSHTGRGDTNEDYYCFGQKVLAPGAGTVVSVENAVEDNAPRIRNPAQPMGNHVILDHGNGEFSFLAHFRKGTVVVKKGDAVKAGDLLGQAGNSGNSTEPHLHYHLQDTPDFGKGRGLPAAFAGYLADGKPVALGEPTKGQAIETK